MDKLENLKKLKSLFDEGLISEKEYYEMKNEILSGNQNIENTSKEINFENKIVETTGYKITDGFEDNIIADKDYAIFPKEYSKYLIILIVIVLVVSYYIIEIMPSKGNNDSSVDNSVIEKYENINSKQYKDLTFDEWKLKADYSAQKYYEGMKKTTLADMYTSQDCSVNYNNDWVEFRDAIDERSNLTREQQETLKDYFNKKREEIITVIRKKQDENDRKNRPNNK